MPQSIIITLTLAGSDTGPFDLFTDADGYASPFASGVSKTSLTAGYLSTVIPDAATIIKVVSKGLCTNAVFLPIQGVPQTTTSSTSSSSSSSSTSSSSTSNTTSTFTTKTKLTCVNQVFFLVTQGGVVAYSSCCGGTVVQVGVEEGYQSINACLILNSLAPAPMGGAVISEIGYSAVTCNCP